MAPARRLPDLRKRTAAVYAALVRSTHAQRNREKLTLAAKIRALQAVESDAANDPRRLLGRLLNRLELSHHVGARLEGYLADGALDLEVVAVKPGDGLTPEL